MPTIAFATLGCRVNQYDTDSMRGLFLAAGFTEADFNGPADVYVINTCSVTQVGEKKSRQLIRRTKKRNDAAKVIVTGCYAQLDPELLTSMPEVDAVVGPMNASASYPLSANSCTTKTTKPSRPSTTCAATMNSRKSPSIRRQWNTRGPT